MTDQTAETSADLLVATSLMTSLNSPSAIAQCASTALIVTSSHSQIENPSKLHQSLQCQLKLPSFGTSEDTEQTENSFTKCMDKQDLKTNEKQISEKSEQIQCPNENFAKNQDEFSKKVNETLLDPSCNLSTKIKKEISFSGNLGNLAIKSSTNYGDLNTTANNLLPSNSAFVNNALVSIDHEPMDKVTKTENEFKIINDDNVKIKKSFPTNEKVVDYQTSSDKYTEILRHSPKDQKILPQLLQQKVPLTIHQKLSSGQNNTDEQPLDLTIPYKRPPSPVCTLNKQENSTEHPLDLSFKKQNNFIKKFDSTNNTIRNPYDRYKMYGYQNLMMHQKQINNQQQDDNVNSFISKLQQQLPQFHQRSFTLEQRRLNDSQPLRAFLQKPSQKSSMGDVNNPICVDDVDNLNNEPTKRLVTNFLNKSTNKRPVHENQAKNINTDNQSVILGSNGNNCSFGGLSKENQFTNSLGNCFTNSNLDFYNKNTDDKHARYNQSNKITSNKISFQNSFFITEPQNFAKRNNLANDININNDIPNNGAFANGKNNEAKIFENEKFCIDDRLNAHKNHYQLSSFDKNSSNHINNRNHDPCNLASYLRQQNTHHFNYSGNFPLSTSFIQNPDVAMNTNSSNIFSSLLIKPHSTNNPPIQMNTAISTQSQLSAFINFSKNISHSSTYPSSITLITSSKCTITSNSSNGGLISTNITNFSNCTVINNYSPNVQNSGISKNVNPNCANLADIKNGTFNPNLVNNLTFSLNNLINNTNPYNVNVKFPIGRNSKVIPVANVQPFMKNRFTSNQTAEPIIINPSPSPPYSNHNPAFQQHSFNNPVLNPVTKSSNCHTSASSDLIPSQTGVFHSLNNLPKANKDAMLDGKFNRTFFQPSNLTAPTNQTTSNLKDNSSTGCNNENHINKLPCKDYTTEKTTATGHSMENKNAQSVDNNGLDFNNNNTKDVDKSSHTFNKKISSRPNETKSKRKQNSSIEYIDEDDDDTAESITESRNINSNENVSEFKDTPNKTNNKIQANISLKSNSKNSVKKLNKKNIKTGFGANNSVNNKNDINERDVKNNSLNSSFVQIATTTGTFVSSHDPLFINTSNTNFSKNAKTDKRNIDNLAPRLYNNDFPIESEVVIKKENCSKENTSFCLAHDSDANENMVSSLPLSSSQNTCSQLPLTSSSCYKESNNQPNNYLHENIKEERKDIYEKSCMNSEHAKGSDNQSENHAKFYIPPIHNQVYNLSTSNLNKPHLSNVYSTETQKLSNFCNYRPESSFHQFSPNQSHGGTSSIVEENSDQKNVKNASKRSSKGKAIMKKNQWRSRELIDNATSSHSLPPYNHHSADQHGHCVDAGIHPSHKQSFHPTLKLPFFSNKTFPSFQNYELKNAAQNEASNPYSIERNENFSWLNNFNENSVDCINSEAHSLEANNINLSSLSKTKNTNNIKKSSINNGNSFNKGNNDKSNVDNLKNNVSIKSQVGFYVSAFRNSNKGKQRKNIQTFPQTFPLSNPKKLGETKLHMAVKSQSCTLVMKYLNEINCNVQDNMGNTPLHLSTRLNNWQLSVILLAHGALPNAKTLDGTRPIENAIRNNSFSLVHLLLSHGADITLTDLHGNKLSDKTTSRKMKHYLEGLVSELKGRPIERFLWGFPSLDLESGLLADLPPDDTESISSNCVFDVFSSTTLSSPAVYAVCTKQQSKPLLCHLFTDVCKFLSTSQKAFLNKHLHNKYKTTSEKNTEKSADNISLENTIDFEYVQDRIVLLDAAQISTVEKLFEDPNLHATNPCACSTSLSNSVVSSNTNSSNLKPDSKSTRQCPKSSSFATSTPSLQKYILINEKLKSMMKIHVINTNSEMIQEDEQTNSVGMPFLNSFESDNKIEGLKNNSTEKPDETKNLIISSTSFSTGIEVSAINDNSKNTSNHVNKTPTTLPSRITDATYSAKTLDNEANSFSNSSKNLKRKASSTENMVVKSFKSSTRSQNNNVFEGLTKLAKICKSTVPLVKNIANKNKNLFGSTSKDFIKNKTNLINHNGKEETNGVKKRGNAKKIESSGLSKSKKCEVVNDVSESKDCKTSKRRI